MHLFIQDLTHVEHQKLKEALVYIKAKTAPTSILCYGLRRQQIRSTQCFTDNTLSTHCQFDLLVVCADGRQVAGHDIANAVSDDWFECIISLCTEKEMHHLLQEGNQFITTVYHTGTILYHSGTQLLTTTDSYPTRAELLIAIKNSWHRWYSTASGFMDCASFCIAETNFSMAAFMIHQAIEHTCKAMLRVLMGFNLRTHNLAWILKLCGRLSEDINPLFPRKTEHDKSLFNILKSSYMDCRYASGFEVTEQQAWVLFDRACALQKIACDLCHDKIRQLEGTGITKEAAPEGQLPA